MAAKGLWPGSGDEGGNWLGVDNWEGWWDTQEAVDELYPDYSNDYDCPQYVADAIIYDWKNKS